MRKLELDDLRERDRELLRKAGEKGGSAAYTLAAVIVLRLYFWTGKHWMRGGPQ